MHLWIIPLLPLAGAAINGLLGKRFPKALVNTIALGSTALAFAYALWVAAQFAGLPPDQIPHIERYAIWLSAGSFSAEYGIYLDQLSLVMLLVVTGVGFLIHVYSVGYMAHEGGYYRYFAYLNIFMFFMLTLVLANNYLLMFVGWEGVGPGLVPADRLLVPQEERSRCRQEGVHHQPCRRLRLPDRAVSADQALRHAAV